MDFGIGHFPPHDAVGPGEIARRVEERGQSAIFFAEHTHIPGRAGVAVERRASAWLPSAPWGAVAPRLEKWEQAIAQLTGAGRSPGSPAAAS